LNRHSQVALLTPEPIVLFGFAHQLPAHERTIAAICFIAVMKEGEFCFNRALGWGARRRRALLEQHPAPVVAGRRMFAPIRDR